MQKHDRMLAMQNKTITGTEKMCLDLAWRGPNDKPMGHVVLTRAQADEVLTELAKLRSGAGRWRDADAEIQRLQEALKTCRELRAFDAQQLREGKR